MPTKWEGLAYTMLTCHNAKYQQKVKFDSIQRKVKLIAFAVNTYWSGTVAPQGGST